MSSTHVIRTKLEAALTSEFERAGIPISCRGALCDQFVRHLTVFPSTSFLEAHGIDRRIVVCGPGKAVLTTPDEYHTVYNLGENLSLSINLSLLGEPTK